MPLAWTIESIRPSELQFRVCGVAGPTARLVVAPSALYPNVVLVVPDGPVALVAVRVCGCGPFGHWALVPVQPLV